MRSFLAVLFMLVVTYSLAAGAAVVFRRNLLYVFDSTPADLSSIPRTSVKLLPPGGSDPQLIVWVTEPEPGKPIILYFMGNAGSLSVHEPRLRAMAEMGFGIAAMAYRGGGAQVGKPSEAALNHDADRVYAALGDLFRREVPGRDLVIYGYALGTGLAVRLASEVDEMAVVLEAPFSRMCDVVWDIVPIFPVCTFMWDERYDSVDLIDKVDSTILFVHGYKDQIIRPELGERLFNKAREPKFTKIYARGGHTDLGRYGANEYVARFLDTLRGRR